MKLKKIVGTLCLAAALPVVANFATTAAPNVQIPFFSASVAHAQISVQEAKNIALNYVGLSESQVYFTKVKTDYEDWEYEIEFVANGVEHEFEIWFDGRIKSYETEYRGY